MVLQLFNEEGRENAREDGHSCAEDGHIWKDVKMRAKMGTVVPKMGAFVHLIEEPTDYRTAIAMALHEELDNTYRAIKMAMRWTGASERTVKYWLSGERGPSGDHLIALARRAERRPSDRSRAAL